MRFEPFRPLPETVKVSGREVPVNTDFRLGIALELEVLSSGEPDVRGLLERFYPGGVPEDLTGALDAMLDFWRGADRGPAEEGEQNAGKSERWYDYAQDAGVLLSSFLLCYGIDLDTARLHWWTFRRLMLNLPAECPFMQRVHYRVADLSKLSKEERKRYRKLKELYRLREPVRRPRPGTPERDPRERLLRRFEEAQRYAEEQEV